MNSKFQPIRELNQRLDLVRSARQECFSRIKHLLSLLWWEDNCVCNCAIEEEEILEQIGDLGEG